MHNERDDPPRDADAHTATCDDELSASRKRRVDGLQTRAVEAWRELGPDGDGAPIERSGEAFVNAVMAQLADVTPRLVAMDLPLPPAQTAASGHRWSRWLGGAAAGAAAVLVATSLLGPSEPQPETAAVAGLPAATSDTAPDFPQDDRVGIAVPADLDDKIEGYIADYGRNYGPAFKFHGVVIVARHGRVGYSRGFGTATRDGDPNTVDTRFRLGLLTEPFTAVAVMQLVEAEVLDIDAPVAAYLPEYPRGEQITINDLLTHRSGIPNYTDDPAFHRWKSQPHDTDAVVARFSDLPLEFEPGSETAPSNANYFLLGAIIERVSGQSFGEFVRDHQFIPAGMTASSFGDAFATGEQAEGNVWNDEEFLEPPGHIDMSTFGAAGGLVATPADMVRWDSALRSGALISHDAAEQIASPTEEGYGFGWVVSSAYGQRLLSFPGAIDGYSAGMLHFERDGTTIIVLANTEVVPGSVVAQDVAMMVYGDMPPKRNEPAEIDIAPRTHHKYVGTYSITDRTRAQYGHQFDRGRFDLLARVHVESEGDRLFFDVPGHARSWMHPMGRNRFFFKDHSGNRVSFELGEDRRAHKLVVHYKDAEFELQRMAPL